MKSLLSLLAALAIVAFSLDASAARLAGARSFGVQRPIPAQRAAPAAQQAKPAAPAATPPAAGNRWLGPLAGLAAGLGLGWLLSQGGFGGGLAMIIMALLAGAAVFALLRAFARPRASLAGAPGPWRVEPAAALPAMAPATAPAPGTSPEPANLVPEGFDSAGFLRQAKLNFIRLQDANDRRDLDTLKEVTTEQMYEELAADIAPRSAPQHTDVVNLDASLLEVSTEGDRHWASVRFHGEIREDQSDAQPFEEVWHLQKPVSGNTGWLLAGIQQVS